MGIPNRSWYALLTLLSLAGMVVVSTITSRTWAASGTLKTVYVSPTGTNLSACGTQTVPCRTISYALSKKAYPGTTIIVLDGSYPEYLKTYRNGKADSPIVLLAQGKVLLPGSSASSRVMDVLHDHYRVSGFEFTGRDVLLRLYEADYTTIDHNTFHHAQGECVRVKYQSSNNTVARNRIEYCGLTDFGGGGTGKNGEGVYIGTAPEQADLNKSRNVDRSNNNLVSNNLIVTHGNECVDIKEGAEQNFVEFNDCSQQKDPNSAGLDSRGNSNTFRYNRTYNNTGAGIRFGGDLVDDGIHNNAYGNEIFNNLNVAIKVARLPQGLICGNIVHDNKALSNEPTIQNPPCDFPLQPPGIQPEGN